MKVFKGQRGPQGTLVTVDGQPLAMHTELRDFKSDGFEWGYEGSGPSQLALAILAEHRGPDDALRYFRHFMQTIIAEIESDEWTLTSDDIEQRASEVTIVNMDLETLLRKVRGEI